MSEITPKEAIANLNHIYGMVAPDIQKSLDVAIKALEEVKAYRECPMPVVLFPSGEKIILTDGHIQALCDYEKEQMAKEIIERFMKELEENTWT